ncbi:type II secretion system protein [Neobacillus sp. NPDC097160]|uniref:type II secretion system protein n=1 Tax=Neobacillus sp. NPDC097160 TaxID=3364298 RepID=UPI0037FF23ED
MLQKLKMKLKDQKGLTLIELLAVIVILGIIAAIAVPSILGLIDNTKKDAHVANAQQMVNSAKMAIASDANLQEYPIAFLDLKYLQDKKYLETVEDPDNEGYKIGTSTGVLTNLTETDAVSFVKIEKGKVTAVKLVNATRGVQDSTKNPLPPTGLVRGSVNPK